MTAHVCQLIGCHAVAKERHRGMWLCQGHLDERHGTQSNKLTNYL